MKQFKERQIVLKNGSTLVIREAKLEDAKNLRPVIKEYVEESEFVPYVKNEYQLDETGISEWIQTFIDQENSILLLAIIDGEFAGNITVNGMQREVLKHTAILGIGMLKKYRGLGIGSALFEAVIDWSKNHPIIEYLGLETYDDNIVGLKLYEKFNFKQVGNQEGFIKLPDGTYRDNIIMTLKVK